MPDEIVLRDVRQEDMPFIFKSWVRSYTSALAKSLAAPLCKSDLFGAVQIVVDRVIARPETRIVVAQDATVDDQLWGFVVYEPGDLLHFIYVKHLARRRGIGTRLKQLAEAKACTFRTRAGMSLLSDLPYKPKRAHDHSPCH